MSLSTDGFTLLGNLKVPSLGVGVTSSNTPLLIKAADLTTAMVNNLRTDWGDLRLSADEAGNTQLPLDIAATDYAWTRLTSVAADTLIYVWGNKPAAVKEINAATYGRNAVWDYPHFNLGNGEDSSGLTAGFNLNSQSVVSAKIGDGVDVAARSPYTGYNETALDILTSDYRIGLWVNLDAGSGGWSSVIRRSGSVALQRWSTDDAIAIFHTATNGLKFAAGTWSAFVGEWSKLDVTRQGTSLKLYKNGALLDSITYTTAVGASSAQLLLGGEDTTASPKNPAFGLYDNLDYQTQLASQNQISIEYQNQSASGAWWIAEDAGGGGGGVTGLTSLSTQLREPITSTTSISASFREPVTGLSSFTSSFRESITNTNAITTLFREAVTGTTSLNTDFRQGVSSTTPITFDLLGSSASFVTSLTSFNTSFRESVFDSTSITTSFRESVSQTHSLNTSFRQGVSNTETLLTSFIGRVTHLAPITTSFREGVTSYTDVTFALYGELDWTIPAHRVTFTFNTTAVPITFNTTKPII